MCVLTLWENTYRISLVTCFDSTTLPQKTRLAANASAIVQAIGSPAIDNYLGSIIANNKQHCDNLT